MKIRSYIGVYVGKMIRFILHIVNYGGTNLPGVIAEKLNKNILVDLAQNTETVLIIGTNGKSTTLRIVEHLFNLVGIDYFSNYEGANIATGIISTFIANINPKDSKKKIALIECDELYVDRICKQLHPKIILITNLYDDQKERFGNVEQLANKLNNLLKKSNATLCINKDCESLRLICDNTSNKVIEYSVVDNDIVVDKERINIKSNLRGPWNLSNIAGACAIAHYFKIDKDKLYLAFNDIKMPYGRMEEININDTKIIINLAKNPHSLDTLLEYLIDQKLTDTLVIGINSKPGDIKDSRWLRDAKKLLLLNQFNKIWLCGDSANVTEIILSDVVINKDKIEVTKSSSHMIKKTINSKQKVMMLLNYTCMMEVRSILVKKGYINNRFWQKPTYH